MPDNDITSVILIGTDGVPYSASGSGVSQTDGSAFTPNTSSMVPVGGLYESTPSAVSDGDAGTLGMTANRVLKAALHNASGAAITTLPVSLASVTPGTAASDLGKAEDAGHTSGDVGVMALGVRNDTGATTTNTDADYSPVSVNSRGQVIVSGPVGHDISVAGLGGPLILGGVASAAAPSSVSTDGDAVRGWFLLNGAQAVNITAAGALIGGDASNGLDVDVTRSALPTGASTLAEQQTQTTALQLIDDVVYTDDNGFTPATSKLIVIGGQADETGADSVNEGDAGAFRMTLDRYQKVVSQHSDTIRASGTERSLSRAAVAAASSGNNTLVTNSNGGLTIRVYAMALVATAAVSLYFTADAGGTVVFGGSTNKIALAANGGFVLPYNPAGWFDTSANTDVVMNLSGAIAVSGGIVYAEV